MPFDYLKLKRENPVSRTARFLCEHALHGFDDGIQIDHGLLVVRHIADLDLAFGKLVGTQDGNQAGTQLIRQLELALQAAGLMVEVAANTRIARFLGEAAAVPAVHRDELLVL